MISRDNSKLLPNTMLSNQSKFVKNNLTSERKIKKHFHRQKDRIKYLGRRFIRDGKIDFDDRQDLIDMHGVYHNALGGNGNLDKLMEEVMELPVK